MACAVAALPPVASAGVNRHPWDAAASGWNHHAALIHNWLHDATQTMLDEAHIGPGARILDIAAGAGDQTLEIARRVESTGWVLATDVSHSILALADKNAKEAGLKQISTQVADAQQLGLGGANFDAAVCRLGLMFCHSPAAALREARIALKPQGRLTALVFGLPERNPCVTMTLATARQHAGLANALPMQPANMFEPGTLMSLSQPGLLEKLLLNAGFVDVAVHAVSAPFHAASVEHYIDFLRSSAAPIIEILAPLSVAAKQNAWDDMTEQLRVFSTQTGWVGPNSLLRCIAVSP